MENEKWWVVGSGLVRSRTYTCILVHVVVDGFGHRNGMEISFMWMGLDGLRGDGRLAKAGCLVGQAVRVVLDMRIVE